MSITIGSGSQKILIKGSEGLLKKISASGFGAGYIPNFSLINEQANPELSLSLSPGPYDLKNDYPEFYFSFPENEVSAEDIFTIIDYCLEYDRQLHGVYTVHGSACAKNDKGVLIFGPVSGLGKTSLMLELCKNHGFVPLGDEKILVNDNPEIVGGVTRLSLNKPQISRIMGAAMESYDMAQGDLLPAYKKSVKLSAVVIPFISPGSHFDSEKLTSAEANWHLYEEVSRKIRGTSRRVSDFSHPVVSLDTQPLSARRSEAVKKISSDIDFFRIRGDLASVAKEIDRLVS
ncbi:MAG TPA: hypothetical protein VFJ84_02810 [Candidatus Saccharimonadales bacterium]|nr:hypothetical protein [Candidatus Saccharimonadales bacterium]